MVTQFTTDLDAKAHKKRLASLASLLDGLEGTNFGKLVEEHVPDHATATPEPVEEPVTVEPQFTIDTSRTNQMSAGEAHYTVHWTAPPKPAPTVSFKDSGFQHRVAHFTRMNTVQQTHIGTLSSYCEFPFDTVRRSPLEVIPEPLGEHVLARAIPGHLETVADINPTIVTNGLNAYNSLTTERCEDIVNTIRDDFGFALNQHEVRARVKFHNLVQYRTALMRDPQVQALYKEHSESPHYKFEPKLDGLLLKLGRTKPNDPSVQHLLKLKAEAYSGWYQPDRDALIAKIDDALEFEYEIFDEESGLEIGMIEQTSATGMLEFESEAFREWYAPRRERFLESRARRRFTHGTITASMLRDSQTGEDTYATESGFELDPIFSILEHEDLTEKTGFASHYTKLGTQEERCQPTRDPLWRRLGLGLDNDPEAHLVTAQNYSADVGLDESHLRKCSPYKGGYTYEVRKRIDDALKPLYAGSSIPFTSDVEVIEELDDADVLDVFDDSLVDDDMFRQMENERTLGPEIAALIKRIEARYAVEEITDDMFIEEDDPQYVMKESRDAVAFTYRTVSLGSQEDFVSCESVEQPEPLRLSELARAKPLPRTIPKSFKSSQVQPKRTAEDLVHWHSMRARMRFSDLYSQTATYTVSGKIKRNEMGEISCNVVRGRGGLIVDDVLESFGSTNETINYILSPEMDRGDQTDSIGDVQTPENTSPFADLEAREAAFEAWYGPERDAYIAELVARDLAFGDARGKIPKELDLGENAEELARLTDELRSEIFEDGLMNYDLTRSLLPEPVKTIIKGARGISDTLISRSASVSTREITDTLQSVELASGSPEPIVYFRLNAETFSHMIRGDARAFYDSFIGALVEQYEDTILTEHKDGRVTEETIYETPQWVEPLDDSRLSKLRAQYYEDFDTLVPEDSADLDPKHTRLGGVQIDVSKPISEGIKDIAQYLVGPHRSKKVVLDLIANSNDVLSEIVPELEEVQHNLVRQRETKAHTLGSFSDFVHGYVGEGFANDSITTILPDWMKDTIEDKRVAFTTRRYAGSFDIDLKGSLEYIADLGAQSPLVEEPEVSEYRDIDRAGSELAAQVLGNHPFVLKQYTMAEEDVDLVIRQARKHDSQYSKPIVTVQIDGSMHAECRTKPTRAFYESLVQKVVAAVDGEDFVDDQKVAQLKAYLATDFSEIMPEQSVTYKLFKKAGDHRAQPILDECAELGENLERLAEYIMPQDTWHNSSLYGNPQPISWVLQMTDAPCYQKDKSPKAKRKGEVPKNSALGQKLNAASQCAQTLLYSVSLDNPDNQRLGVVVPGWAVDLLAEERLPRWYESVPRSARATVDAKDAFAYLHQIDL